MKLVLVVLISALLLVSATRLRGHNQHHKHPKNNHKYQDIVEKPETSVNEKHHSKEKGKLLIADRSNPVQSAELSGGAEEIHGVKPIEKYISVTTPAAQELKAEGTLKVREQGQPLNFMSAAVSLAIPSDANFELDVKAQLEWDQFQKKYEHIPRNFIMHAPDPLIETVESALFSMNYDVLPGFDFGDFRSAPHLVNIHLDASSLKIIKDSSTVKKSEIFKSHKEKQQRSSNEKAAKKEEKFLTKAVQNKFTKNSAQHKENVAIEHILKHSNIQNFVQVTQSDMIPALPTEGLYHNEAAEHLHESLEAEVKDLIGETESKPQVAQEQTESSIIPPLPSTSDILASSAPESSAIPKVPQVSDEQTAPVPEVAAPVVPEIPATQEKDFNNQKTFKELFPPLPTQLDPQLEKTTLETELSIPSITENQNDLSEKFPPLPTQQQVSFEQFSLIQVEEQEKTPLFEINIPIRYDVEEVEVEKHHESHNFIPPPIVQDTPIIARSEHSPSELVPISEESMRIAKENHIHNEAQEHLHQDQQEVVSLLQTSQTVADPNNVQWPNMIQQDQVEQQQPEQTEQYKYKNAMTVDHPMIEENGELHPEQEQPYGLNDPQHQYVDPLPEGQPEWLAPAPIQQHIEEEQKEEVAPEVAAEQQEEVHPQLGSSVPVSTEEFNPSVGQVLSSSVPQEAQEVTPVVDYHTEAQKEEAAEEKAVEEKVDYGYPASEDYNGVQAANPQNTLLITLPNQQENEVQFFKELDNQTGPHYADYSGQEYIVDPEHEAMKISNDIPAAEVPIVENH